MDIIVAPATAAGGAIAVVRLSGEGSLSLVDRFYRGKVALAEAAANTIHYGNIVDDQEIVDDVLVSVFRAPRSYTGEESVEISCHGSQYIVSQILLLAQREGAKMAAPGEFTTRAFLAGKIDLSQAEAVADLIASSSRAAHAIASTQMRGGYSAKLGDLRGSLLNLMSLLELELDFGEEDVEFADRSQLSATIAEISNEVERLSRSFRLGNAIKEGVAVAIIGRPNVGKSTLLNALLDDERAMVSSVAGTTRDTIEATINLDGIIFRFIDTAGIHDTNDQLEQMGIERSKAAIEKADIVIHLTENKNVNNFEIKLREDQQLITVINKIDLLNSVEIDGLSATKPANEQIVDNSNGSKTTSAADLNQIVNNINKLSTVVNNSEPTIKISAKNKVGIEQLKQTLKSKIDQEKLYQGDIVVSNHRHHQELKAAAQALESSQNAIKNSIPTDLLAQDLREVLHHIGAITGEITTTHILENIFSKFCIGK